MFEKIFASSRVGQEDPRLGAGTALLQLRPPVAGVPVTEITAQRFSAVFRAINVTANAVMTLPFRIQQAQSRKPADHAANDLLQRLSNPQMPARRFRRLLTGHALSWGNGYAEIERGRAGQPVALWPIAPTRVTPRRDDDGTIYYEVLQPRGGGKVRIDFEDMFHLMGPSLDGITGMSRIALARETISLGIAAEQFASSFYGNGAWLGGIIKAAAGRKGLSDEGRDNLLKTFNRRHRGAAKGRQVEYLDAGLDFVELGIPQKDAEFIQTRTMTLDDIARWFDVPPHKLMQMQRSIYNNIEAQEIAFVRDGVVVWAVSWEEEADFKLLGDDPTIYSKMNVNGLMRGDSQMRGAFYQTMFNIGAFSPNEIRDFEDMDPFDGGDYHYMQVNMTTVEPDGRDTAPASAAPAAAPAPAPDDEAARATAAVITETVRRLLTKERNAVSRHLADADFGDWAADFYEAHARQLAEALDAPAQALLAVMKLPRAEAATRLYATAYCRERVRALAELEQDQEPQWPAAEDEARALIKRITGVN